LKGSIKEQVSCSKREKLIIYFLGGALFAFIIFIFYYQERMAKITLQSGKKIQVWIFKVDCTTGKTKSRPYFGNEKGEIKHVNVNYQDCERFKVDDTIYVYENKDKDWYEIDPASIKKSTQ
jgi:hypothetical protein